MTTTTLTTASMTLFRALASDAGEWGGEPPLNVNVSTNAAARGNITDLKQKGLIDTYRDGGETWVRFSDAGRDLAATMGIRV